MCCISDFLSIHLPEEPFSNVLYAVCFRDMTGFGVNLRFVQKLLSETLLVANSVYNNECYSSGCHSIVT